VSDIKMILDFIGFIDANCGLPTDEKVTMLDDFCAQYSYRDTVTGEDGREIPNPTTKRDFANQRIRDFIVQTVNAHRIGKARAAVEYDTFSL